jgi:hypothetical protein
MDNRTSAADSVMVLNPETIVWGELCFVRTLENLRKDSRASILCREKSPRFKACRVNGRVTIHENDVIATQLDERVQTAMEWIFNPGGKN